MLKKWELFLLVMSPYIITPIFGIRDIYIPMKISFVLQLIWIWQIAIYLSPKNMKLRNNILLYLSLVILILYSILSEVNIDTMSNFHNVIFLVIVVVFHLLSFISYMYILFSATQNLIKLERFFNIKRDNNTFYLFVLFVIYPFNILIMQKRIERIERKYCLQRTC